MLDRGLLTINDDDPQQNFISRITKEPKSMGFGVRGGSEGNSNVCELMKLPQIKIEQGLMDSTVLDRDGDENVKEEEEDDKDDNKNLLQGKGKRKTVVDSTPSILKTSLLAGAAATLASLSAAPIKLQVKRLETKTTTSFLQSALLATDKSNNPSTKLNNLNVNTKLITKQQQQEKEHSLHAFKPALTLATLSEIASARKQQMELEEQQQQQQEMLIKHKTLDGCKTIKTTLAEKATLSQAVLKICSCNTAITNPTQLLAFKPLTATTTTKLNIVHENFNNKYQASSTQTCKIPTIRTATATTQTQTDELLDTTTTTTTTTKFMNNAIVSKTTLYNNTKQLLVENGAKTKAIMTTTTTSSSQHKTKMTAVSVCKEHVTHLTPSLPSSTTILSSTTPAIRIPQQQQQLILLTQKQSSSMIPTLIPTSSSSSSSQQQQQQQQQPNVHNRHRQQQQELQQHDAATSNGAVTVVVFKTMLPDD